MTLYLWIHIEENTQVMLQKKEIATVITRNHIFDFLIDIMPIERLKVNSLGLGFPKDGLQLYPREFVL